MRNEKNRRRNEEGGMWNAEFGNLSEEKAALLG